MIFKILFIFITSLLGLFRNYAKHKQVNFLLFFRSPIIICILHYYLNIEIKISIILERWILLFYKGLLSYANDDYNKKKIKYKIKYKK